jgi:hypothetical protein
MDATKEVIAYLRTLMEHYDECGKEDCPECTVVRAACEFVRNRIFAPGVTPEVQCENVSGFRQPAFSTRSLFP